VITTVCDESISDTEVIRDLLQKISKDNLDLSITIRQGQDDWGESKTTSYNNVRLNKITDEGADFCVYRSSGNLNLRKVQFQNIVEVRVISCKTDLLRKKGEVSRLDLMDVD